VLGLLRCPVCRAAAGGPLGLCARCQEGLLEPGVSPFDLSLGVYGGPLERAVRAYKFGGVRRLGRFFGVRLAELVERAEWPLDAVCAVPLYPLRYLQRGYNQSALIARVVAQQRGLPYRPLLRRVRATRQQARLGGSARGNNVAGAFRAAPLQGERVLLIDDVQTSGATATECALTLFTAGAGRVYVATVARAQDERVADG
jgi:ComF family protein